eukprot:7368054-Heterocapsa_arctica.AAC.1
MHPETVPVLLSVFRSSVSEILLDPWLVLLHAGDNPHNLEGDNPLSSDEGDNPPSPYGTA